jgi:hypothetical protein
MTAWSPWERRLCFLLPFMMRLLLWCLRVSSYGGGDPAAFPARHPPGRGVDLRGGDRRSPHPREVVPRDRRLLPELAQHHARAGRRRGLLHARGDDARSGVDVAGGVQRRPLMAPLRGPRALHLRGEIVGATSI